MYAPSPGNMNSTCTPTGAGCQWLGVCGSAAAAAGRVRHRTEAGGSCGLEAVEERPLFEEEREVGCKPHHGRVVRGVTVVGHGRRRGWYRGKGQVRTWLVVSSTGNRRPPVLGTSPGPARACNRVASFTRSRPDTTPATALRRASVVVALRPLCLAGGRLPTDAHVLDRVLWVASKRLMGQGWRSLEQPQA